MKVSYNWIKELSGADVSPERMGEILTETGLEVEGIERVQSIPGGLEGVVIGQVKSCEKHPDADRLKVTTVDISTGEDLQIVCGAPNVAAGQKVLVATVGSTLYPKPNEPFKIKKSKIRGVESIGMICAEDELGLGTSHDGILVLPEDATVGEAAARFFQLEDDYQLEIGLTPNRSDALGHIGVARDLIAYLNIHEQAELQLNWPEFPTIKATNSDHQISVEIEAPKDCLRYIGMVVRGIQVAESPEWMKQKLVAIGLNPINNVVDCTNYVMRELGTPLHAFDLKAVKEGILVRHAKEGEELITLDGEKRSLDQRNLMITNGKESLAIAGVLGGEASGVKDDTTDLFLESAYFDAVSVRKTAKMHGLNTDASFRYERGVDPELTLKAMQRLLALIIETAGGEASGELMDVHPGQLKAHELSFSPLRARKLMGCDISESEMEQILKQLDIEVLDQANEQWKLRVPQYRVDVTREVDVVEEILRIYGFNRVPIPSKLNSSIQHRPKLDQEKIKIEVSNLLNYSGLSEVLNNSLYASERTSLLASPKSSLGEVVSLLNPLSQDLDSMRQSLLGGILDTIVYNQNRQHPNLKLFEFGKIYGLSEGSYQENERLIIALSGKKLSEQWNHTPSDVNYYSLKGIVHKLLDRLGIIGHLKEADLDCASFSDGVDLYILKNKIGSMGWVNRKVLKAYGVKQEVFVADLDWDAVLDSLKLKKVQFKELPKSFEMRRDYSLLLDEKVSYANIRELAGKVDRSILKEMSLFDVYEGDKLEKGKKSYAVAFYFQDAEKTLKDARVDQIMEQIRGKLEKELGAELR
ncbi:MAG: phenylalanine--tRNA ligase subunit beta [Bacteroidetes bacterium]|nr:MAG: phenylalanine--tRNA ligase subunit beta [Bacteroidota bacterium]